MAKVFRGLPRVSGLEPVGAKPAIRYISPSIQSAIDYPGMDDMMFDNFNGK